MSEESADREVWKNGIERSDGTLLFGFDTDHPEFARGTEFGQVFMEMCVRPDPYHREIHASNIVMVKRAAKALNRPVSTEEVVESMGMVYLLRVGPLPERPAPMPPNVPPPEGQGGIFREQS